MATRAEIVRAIDEAAAKYGVDPQALLTIANIESRLNPSAQNPNSSAGGLFQFIDSTARGYGLSDRFDYEQAADAGARLARDNARALRSALGRDPEPWELYLAHQQGAGGAIKLLTNPDAKASSLLGSAAVSLNFGDTSMTAREFASKWKSRYGRAAGLIPKENIGSSTFRQGSRGEGVRDLQSRLKSAGFNIAVDGDFGPDTARAVREFQQRRGLTVDGIVGPKTLAALRPASEIQFGIGDREGSRQMLASARPTLPPPPVLPRFMGTTARALAPTAANKLAGNLLGGSPPVPAPRHMANTARALANTPQDVASITSRGLTPSSQLGLINRTPPIPATMSANLAASRRPPVNAPLRIEVAGATPLRMPSAPGAGLTMAQKLAFGGSGAPVPAMQSTDMAMMRGASSFYPKPQTFPPIPATMSAGLAASRRPAPMMPAVAATPAKAAPGSAERALEYGLASRPSHIVQVGNYLYDTSRPKPGGGYEKVSPSFVEREMFAPTIAGGMIRSGLTAQVNNLLGGGNKTAVASRTSTSGSSSKPSGSGVSPTTGKKYVQGNSSTNSAFRKMIGL